MFEDFVCLMVGLTLEWSSVVPPKWGIVKFGVVQLIDKKQRYVNLS